MPASSRRVLLAACLAAAGLFAAFPAGPPPLAQAADPVPEPPRVTVYDPDPAHLWNRLHEALYVRLDGQGPDEPGELDPFLWQRTPFREKGERYGRAAALLDEFIARRGEKLIADPRKRALLQRDLWTLFDGVAPSRFLVVPGQKEAGLELAAWVAKILPRLALTAEQIRALPDNLAEAVAAEKLPYWVDVSRLWDADGPWVLLGSEDGLPWPRATATSSAAGPPSSSSCGSGAGKRPGSTSPTSAPAPPRPPRRCRRTPASPWCGRCN